MDLSEQLGRVCAFLTRILIFTILLQFNFNRKAIRFQVHRLCCRNCQCYHFLLELWGSGRSMGFPLLQVNPPHSLQPLLTTSTPKKMHRPRPHRRVNSCSVYFYILNGFKDNSFQTFIAQPSTRPNFTHVKKNKATSKVKMLECRLCLPGNPDSMPQRTHPSHPRVALNTIRYAPTDLKKERKEKTL